MDFTWKILFTTISGVVVERAGAGLFYPTDIPAFKLEDMIWEMAEEFGRPRTVVTTMIFLSGENNGTAPKRIEGPKAES